MEIKKLTPRQFRSRVLMVAAAIPLLSAALSFLLAMHFGIVFFGLAVLTSAAGAYLGKAPDDVHSPRNQHMVMQNWNKKSLSTVLAEQARYNITHAAPERGIENILLYGGMLALALSLPFICKIMYG